MYNKKYFTTTLFQRSASDQTIIRSMKKLIAINNIENEIIRSDCFTIESIAFNIEKNLEILNQAPKKAKTSNISKQLIDEDLQTSFTNFELIKMKSNIIQFNRNNLQVLFSEVCDNNKLVVDSFSNCNGSRELFKAIKESLTCVSYDKIISTNLNIMKNKKLKKKFQKYNINVNLPTMFSSFSSNNMPIENIQENLIEEIFHSVEKYYENNENFKKENFNNITENEPKQLKNSIDYRCNHISDPNFSSKINFQSQILNYIKPNKINSLKNDDLFNIQTSNKFIDINFLTRIKTAIEDIEFKLNESQNKLNSFRKLILEFSNSEYPYFENDLVDSIFEVLGIKIELDVDKTQKRKSVHFDTDTNLSKCKEDHLISLHEFLLKLREL